MDEPKVITHIGKKNCGVRSVPAVSSKNAMGTKLPPIFIFSKKRIKNEHFMNTPAGTFENDI